MRMRSLCLGVSLFLFAFPAGAGETLPATPDACREPSQNLSFANAREFMECAVTFLAHSAGEIGQRRIELFKLSALQLLSLADEHRAARISEQDYRAQVSAIISAYSRSLQGEQRIEEERQRRVLMLLSGQPVQRAR